jgi:hypothetical protein
VHVSLARSLLVSRSSKLRGRAGLRHGVDPAFYLYHSPLLQQLPSVPTPFAFTRENEAFFSRTRAVQEHALLPWFQNCCVLALSDDRYPLYSTAVRSLRWRATRVGDSVSTSRYPALNLSHDDSSVSSSVFDFSPNVELKLAEASPLLLVPITRRGVITTMAHISSSLYTHPLDGGTRSERPPYMTMHTVRLPTMYPANPQAKTLMAD